MKPIYLILLLLATTLTACNKEPEQAKKEHLWQKQTEALDEAKKVQKKMNESAEQMKKRMEELQQN